MAQRGRPKKVNLAEREDYPLPNPLITPDGQMSKIALDILDKTQARLMKKESKREQKSMEDLKDSIKDLKPAISASECVNTQITSVTRAKNPETELISEQTIQTYDLGLRSPYPIPNWLANIERYCSSEAITPIELIEQHKSFKKALNSRKTSENTIELRELKVSPNASVKGGNWYQEFAKRKSQGGKTEK